MKNKKGSVARIKIRLPGEISVIWNRDSDTITVENIRTKCHKGNN